jgi:hypothetical protein
LPSIDSRPSLIIAASLAIVGDMYEGMDNVPLLMGSAVRERGQVTGFVSGMSEGAKGLGWGIWDGVIGLFTEPVHGALQEVSPWA